MDFSLDICCSSHLKEHSPFYWNENEAIFTKISAKIRTISPKNTFSRFYSSLRKHPLAASPSDVTTLASIRKSGRGNGRESPCGTKMNTNCDVTGGTIMIPACCFLSCCDFLDEPFFQNSQNLCMFLQIS